jgi:hypothetical protein
MAIPDVPLTLRTFNGGSSSSGQFSPSRNIGGIVGGVIGGLAAIILFSVGGYFLWRRRKSNEEARRKMEIDGNYSPTTSFSAPERRTYPSSRNPTASAYTHIPSELMPTPFTALVSGGDNSNDNGVSPVANSGGHPSPPPVPSGKLARYVVANPPQAPHPTSPSLRSDGSSSGAQDYLSYLPPPSGTSSSHNLRQEVEDLRREVGFLRAQQQQSPSSQPPQPPATPMSFGSPPSEPPPLYTSS